MKKCVLVLVSMALAILMCGVAWADTFTVQNTNDSGPGSLREIISRANANPGGDIIRFAPGARGTIDLKSALPLLGGVLEIRGPGAEGLKVRRSIAPGTPEFRVFELDRKANVAISGLTVSNGLATGLFDDGGGGIWSRAGTTLTLRSVLVSNNQAEGDGGGVRAPFSGTLTVSDSTFSGNSASGGGAIDGGGTVLNSTFSGNSAQPGGGGALNSGDWTIVNSTFSGNVARLGGGAIDGGGTVLNSTFFGNSTRYQGGAIYLQGECEGSGIAEMTVRNSTISNNSAAGKGGGIAAVACNPAFTIEESIVAANRAERGAPDTFGPFLSGGYNLIRDPSGSTGFGPTDLTNTRAGLDPRGLQDNGGPTRTIALVADSPALDAVASGCPPPETDQRGVRRPQNGNGINAARCDIGAYERNAP